MKMRKGFTLVELLIVIVIIGILAAAMLLSGGSATSSAEASNIISNLRSLKAAALLFYMDSMDEVMAANGQVPNNMNVITTLAPYTDNPANFGAGSGYLFDNGAGALAQRWFVGVNVATLATSSPTAEIIEKLAGKARTVGLFGTTGGALPTNIAQGAIAANDNTVWMVAR